MQLDLKGLLRALCSIEGLMVFDLWYLRFAIGGHLGGLVVLAQV